MDDAEILKSLIPHPENLSGQAVLVCDTCYGNPTMNPFVVPVEELEAFVHGFTENHGAPFFKSDAVIVVPDQNTLFMIQNRRIITRYCPQ